MRRKNIRKKKNNLLLLVLLVLGVSVGYAILSTTLNINGIAGINKNTWDIHWENVVPNSSSTVTTETPVISEHATKVSFGVTLELPGDYYEFDVDAKNDGTIPGTITKILPNIYKVVESEEEDNTLPDFIKVSIVYKDTNIEPRLGDILDAGEKQTYTIRVEYDKDATELPDKDISIKVEEDITYSQYDTKGKYVVKFDPNGGSVAPNRIEVTKGEKIGSLPVPTYAEHQFIGWFTELADGTKIDANTIPTGNVKYYAHWTSSYTTFLPGREANAKFKQLAGNNNATYLTADSYVTAVRKSTTEPSSENKTSGNIVSVDGEEPIYAWFDNGTIYYWSAADYIYLNTNADSMFYNLTNVTYIDTDYYTNLTENMSGLFSKTAATSLDLDNFDTSNVNNMTGMFASSEVTSLNLSSFDTSKVTSMSQMFAGCKATSIDFSSFNTENLMYMNQMFSGSYVKDLDISNFNIEKVTSMSNMFAGSQIETLDISGWYYKNVTSLSGLFSGCSKIKSIDMSNSNFGAVNYFSYVFQYLSTLESVNLNNVSTPNITSLDSAFQGCSSLTSLDLSSFDTSNVQYMPSVFYDCTSLVNLDISSFDTSNVTDMACMFYNCRSLTSLDLTNFDTLKVTNMNSMLSSCTNLTTVTVSDTWTTANVSNSSYMFTGSTNIVGGNGTVFNSSHVDKEYAHYDYGTINPGYFNKANLPKNTVTFNPNGGSVDPTSIEVEKYSAIGELPTPTKENSVFDGWYTEIDGGIKITSDVVPKSSVTYYAHWLPKTRIIFDANEGLFNNNKLTNVINYEYVKSDEYVYSHTSNINDSGVANGSYSAYSNNNDVVTIPGAEKLRIEVWYSTENSCDWLAIYPSGITPTDYNFNEATISDGKLTGGASNTKPSDNSIYHKVFIVDGDTAQFYFKSDSGVNYYGYYAIISKTSGYVADNEYIEPVKEDDNLVGWNTEFNETGKQYDDYDDVLDDLGNIREKETLYAQWKGNYTVTLDANGGSVDPEEKEVLVGDSIGGLPVPTYTGHSFKGWYIGTVDAILVDEDYIPTSDITLHAHWDEIEAKFDTGQNVNTKFKQLANPDGTNIEYGTTDTNVLHIRRSNTAPGSGITTLDVSDPENSSVPIYAWFDDTSDTIYWWSTANKEYLHQNSANMFDHFTNVVDIDTHFDTSLVENMTYMFGSTTALVDIDFSNFDTSHVTNMNRVFYMSTSLRSLDLSNWRTSNVTDMYSLFYGMTALEELNISNWDFRNYSPSPLIRNIFGYDSTRLKKLTVDNAIFGADMSYAFASLESMEYFSAKNVDTSRATTFYYMFNNAKKIKYMDLSSFDTSNVTNMSYVFYECSLLEEVYFGDWNTNKVTTFRCLFYDCYQLQRVDLSSFETGNATDMSNVVGYSRNLKEANLSNWDFSKYSTASLMSTVLNSSQDNLKILKLDNTKYGNNMQRAFAGLYNLEVLSLENVDTSNATNMSLVFEGNNKLERLYLNSFDTRNVINMSNMFYNMALITSISVSDDFIVSQVTNSSSMFYNSPNLVGGAGTVYNSSYVDKARAHYDYGPYNPGYFNASSVDRYKVVFNSNGGRLVETNRYVWAGDEIGVLPVPIRDGYTFLGWSTGVSDGVIIDSTYVPTKNITLIARWSNLGTYTVDLDANGGNVDPISINVECGSSIGNLPVPRKDNYIFDGWYIDLESENEIDASYVPDSDTILKAKWRDPNTFTVTFDPNGGQVDEPTRSVTESRSVGDLPIPTRDKYYFIGWWTGLTDGRRVASTEVPTGDVTYYARWKHIYTVTFDANEGSVDPVSVDVIEGLKVGNLPVPVKDHNRFMGWYTDLQTGIKIDKDYIPNSDITVVANWHTTYIMTLDANGGSVTPTSVDVLTGDQMGVLPIATKEGNFNFTGWYYNNTKITYDYVPTGDMTLVADYDAVAAPTGNLANDSWDTISSVAQKGEACSVYNIGDTKEVDMGVYGTHLIRLANCSVSNACEFEGFSQTTCGTVFEFADIITHFYMNEAYPDSDTPGHNTAGSWNASKMRRFVNDDIYMSLPQTLRNNVIPTVVVTGHQYTEDNNYSAIDYLYLLSPYEVFGSTYPIDKKIDSAGGDTVQLDYYRINNVTPRYNHQFAIKEYTESISSLPSELVGHITCDPDNPPKGTIPDSETTCIVPYYQYWWMRTPMNTVIRDNQDSYPDNTFSYVDFLGERQSRRTADKISGVSPAFRLS